MKLVTRAMLYNGATWRLTTAWCAASQCHSEVLHNRAALHNGEALHNGVVLYNSAALNKSVALKQWCNNNSTVLTKDKH